MYLIRLDDASEYMDVSKWNRIEDILDEYNIKPIVGVIPNNKDEDLLKKYEKNSEFWNVVKGWQDKGWEIAIHGYDHKYISKSGGINPINLRSEFAGVDLQIQKDKIKDAVSIFNKYQINPKVFFAPSHTFDLNTLLALKSESTIRIISDTISNDVYKFNDFYFIPQQSGKVRTLPFAIVTFCYHPNAMSDNDFEKLNKFINKNEKKIIAFEQIHLRNREKNIFDFILEKIYFFLKRNQPPNK